MDLVDARRREDGVAQVFPTEESLKEYTKRTASYFPYDSPKAGNLLRHLLRKPRENTISNVMESPLFPPPYKRDGCYRTKNKALSTSTNRGESRSAKKQQIIAESVEGINPYSNVEFESE